MQSRTLWQQWGGWGKWRGNRKQGDYLKLIAKDLSECGPRVREDEYIGARTHDLVLYHLVMFHRSKTFKLFLIVCANDLF